MTFRCGFVLKNSLEIVIWLNETVWGHHKFANISDQGYGIAILWLTVFVLLLIAHRQDFTAFIMAIFQRFMRYLSFPLNPASSLWPHLHRRLKSVLCHTLLCAQRDFCCMSSFSQQSSHFMVLKWAFISSSGSESFRSSWQRFFCDVITVILCLSCSYQLSSERPLTETWHCLLRVFTEAQSQRTWSAEV